MEREKRKLNEEDPKGTEKKGWVAFEAWHTHWAVGDSEGEQGTA